MSLFRSNECVFLGIFVIILNGMNDRSSFPRSDSDAVAAAALHRCPHRDGRTTTACVHGTTAGATDTDRCAAVHRRHPHSELRAARTARPVPDSRRSSPRSHAVPCPSGSFGRRDDYKTLFNKDDLHCLCRLFYFQNIHYIPIEKLSCAAEILI